MQKSIEVEYWVIDRTGELTSPGALTEVSEYVEEEFVEPLFELKTPPCETFTNLRSTFIHQLDTVVSRADELDKLLVPLGTPINSESIAQLPGERGQIQQRVVGTNFDYSKYCAGTHIHFEQRNVTDQLNVLIALDPALALLSSSPYFQGDRIASSARSYLYRKKSYEHFPKHGQLWDYVETVAQWKRRLDRRFDEFTTVAIQKGVDEDVFDTHFSPDTAVWTPVRLRDAMPTVEWRSPDATIPSQILRLVEELDMIMEKLHHTNVRIEGTDGGVTHNCFTLPEFKSACEYSERAIHDGLDSQAVVSYLERMGFTVHEYEPITQHIDHREHIDPANARELRLRCGEALACDVRDLS